MKFFTSKNLKAIEKELMEANPIMTKVIEEYKRFTSDDKLMRAYDARDAFLLGQKMMLNREREEGFEEGIKNEKYSIAKTLKQMNMDDASISKATGLTIEEIQNISAHGKN